MQAHVVWPWNGLMRTLPIPLDHKKPVLKRTGFFLYYGDGPLGAGQLWLQLDHEQAEVPMPLARAVHGYLAASEAL